MKFEYTKLNFYTSLNATYKNLLSDLRLVKFEKRVKKFTRRVNIADFFNLRNKKTRTLFLGVFGSENESQII
jgi:hypothetical protein